MPAVKVWSGTAWVDKTAGIKRWNGSAWVPGTFKHWTGTAWAEISPAAAGVSYVGGASLGANQLNINLAWPGVVEGDVAYVFWTFNPATVVPTDPPTGFTTIGNSTGSGGASPGTRVFRKVCTGSETGNVTVSLDSAARHAAVLVVYRGVDATTPEDVAVAVDNTHSVSPTHNPPPITVSTGGAAIITAIHERVSSGDTGWTPPLGYTERGDTGAGGTGSGGSITAVADDLTGQGEGATITPGNWTGTSPTGFSQIVTYTIALRPAVPALAPLSWMVLGADSDSELATARSNGANTGLVEVFWDQCQTTLGGTVDASDVLAHIARVKAAGMQVCLRVSLQYIPTFVDTAAVKFRRNGGVDHNPGNISGNNARDWVWSASTRALVDDFLTKLFDQLDWADVDRVQLGGGPAGELQYPNSDGTQWWGFSAPAQTGTGLAAGQTVCPVPGHVPSTGTTWTANDTSFVSWYTQSLTNWMLWLIGKHRAYHAGPIWVMHPGSGLRKVSQTPTGSFALAYREQVAKGTDWDHQIAAYPDADVWPYSTWADAAHPWDPDPYSDANDGNGAPWYHLLRIARARGRANRIWGENTGGQAAADVTRIFATGAVALGYQGLGWLSHTTLTAGGGNAGYADLAPRIATANRSAGTYWRGVNMSGAEFGSAFPGTYDVDYHYDSQASFTYVAGRQHKLLRLPVKWERIQPTRGAALDATELGRVLDRASWAASAGAKLLVDVHNYGRYHSGGTELVLGDTLPAADLVDLWTRLSTALKGNAGVWGYDLMNEPHDLPGVSGSFSGTVRYDWSDATVQGWTGDTATAGNVSGSLRLSGTATAGYWNMRKDDAGTLRNNSATGAQIRLKATLGASVTGTDWKLIPQWQNSSFAWQNPTGIAYSRVDNGQTVPRLVAGVPVYVTATFASISSPAAFAVQVESNAATAGQSVLVDIDDLTQGAVTGASTPAQVWEAAAQQCVTAVRNNADPAWLAVEGYSWSSAATWPDEHPAPFVTDPLNRTLYSPHFYFDRDGSGDYPDTYAAESTWAQTQDAASLASWALKRLQRFTMWCRAHGVRGLVGEVGWPNSGDTAGWNAVGEAIYDELDRSCVGATYWATGEWWGTGYILSAYTGTPIGTPASPATVIEAHRGTAR